MEILGDDEVIDKFYNNAIAIIILLLGICLIIIGVSIQYVDYKCEQIDKNSDFWVRNCDYND